MSTSGGGRLRGGLVWSVSGYRLVGGKTAVER